MEQHDLDDEQLEKLMDGYSIMAVLNSLTRICGEKADYVRGGGSHGEPSPYMAGLWQKLAKKLDKVSEMAAGL